jgi:mRNA interferase MazF
MKRGDVVTVSLPGDYGKPRPALVVQADIYAELSSLTVLPFTSAAVSFDQTRVAIAPSRSNGLRVDSQIMVEKITTIARAKAGPAIGRLSPDDFATVHRALALFLGFA